MIFLSRVQCSLHSIQFGSASKQSMPNDESTDNLNFYLDYLVDFFLVSCSPFSPPPFHIRLHRVLVFQHIRRQLVSSFVPRNRCQQRRCTRGRNVCNFSSPDASCTLMPRALLRFNQCHNPLGPRRTVAHVLVHQLRVLAVFVTLGFPSSDSMSSSPSQIVVSQLTTNCFLLLRRSSDALISTTTHTLTLVSFSRLSFSSLHSDLFKPFSFTRSRSNIAQKLTDP